MGTGSAVGRGYAAAVEKAIILLSNMEDPGDEAMARTITGTS